MCLILNNKLNIKKCKYYMNNNIKEIIFYKHHHCGRDKKLYSHFYRYPIKFKWNYPRGTLRLGCDNTYREGCLHLYTNNKYIMPLKVRVKAEDIISFGYSDDVCVKKYYVDAKNYKKAVK